jgi:hypothetical protein
VRPIPSHIVAALALASLMSACALSPVEREDWYEDGALRGTLEIEELGAGFEYRYVDPSDRLLRRERRDARRQLAPGACTTHYRYDRTGRLVETAHRDATGALTPAAEGWAIERVDVSRDAEGNRVEDVCYLDASSARTVAAFGYSARRQTFQGDSDRLARVELLDVDDAPIQATYLGVPGTQVVEYAYLRGATEIVYALCYGTGAEILSKVKISGEVAVERVSTTYQPRYEPNHRKYVR